jgi:DNA segregation ATPase FtsK/SpoIIIE, S-DNA-T family
VIAPLRSLEGTPGVLALLGSELDVEYLRATLNPLDRYVVLVDDAEMLYNAPNSEILERIIVSGRDADHGLILAGTTADLSSCYPGFIATARKSRCGVLVAVDTPDDGDLFGVRLPVHRRLIAWRESPSLRGVPWPARLPVRRRSSPLRPASG